MPDEATSPADGCPWIATPGNGKASPAGLRHRAGRPASGYARSVAAALQSLGSVVQQAGSLYSWAPEIIGRFCLFCQLRTYQYFRQIPPIPPLVLRGRVRMGVAR